MAPAGGRSEPQVSTDFDLVSYLLQREPPRNYTSLSLSLSVMKIRCLAIPVVLALVILIAFSRACMSSSSFERQLVAVIRMKKKGEISNDCETYSRGKPGL